MKLVIVLILLSITLGGCAFPTAWPKIGGSDAYGPDGWPITNKLDGVRR